MANNVAVVCLATMIALLSLPTTDAYSAAPLLLESERESVCAQTWHLDIEITLLRLPRLLTPSQRMQRATRPDKPSMVKLPYIGL